MRVTCSSSGPADKSPYEFEVFVRAQQRDNGAITNEPFEKLVYLNEWVLVGDAFVCHSNLGDEGWLDSKDRELWQITHIATGYRFPAVFLRDNAVLCALTLKDVTNWHQLDTVEKYQDFIKDNNKAVVRVVKRYMTKDSLLSKKVSEPV